jgi:hypothetical protein
LPIVLTSGYAEPSIREADAEGLQVLGKPYRLDDLATALRGALHAVSVRSTLRSADPQLCTTPGS